MDSNGQLLTVIPDGYTRNFYIKAEPGLHGSLRGRVRPMSRIECQELIELQRDGDARTKVYVMAQSMNRHVLTWDAGEKTVERIVALQSVLFDKLFRIVNGDWPGDIDPLAEPSEDQHRIAKEMADSGASQQTVLEGN